MRLNEITKLTERVDYYDATVMLKNAGYRVVGDGHHSEIYYKNGKDYILKLFVSTDNAYIQFLQYCLQNQSCSNLPKFRGKMVKLSNLCYAVRIEKLSPIRTAGDKKIVNLIQFSFDNIFYQNNRTTNLPRLREFDETLAESVDKLATHFKGKDMDTDIKNENIMKRGSTFVIIDPVCDRIYTKAFAGTEF